MLNQIHTFSLNWRNTQWHSHWCSWSMIVALWSTHPEITKGTLPSHRHSYNINFITLHSHYINYMTQRTQSTGRKATNLRLRVRLVQSSSVNKNTTTFCSEYWVLLKPFLMNCDWRMLWITLRKNRHKTKSTGIWQKWLKPGLMYPLFETELFYTPQLFYRTARSI